MIKLKGLALLTTALFAVSAIYAEGNGCCTTQASNKGKMDCSQTYAKLNLTKEQKVKLDALQAKCNKDGCTKESMATFMKSAEGVLSKEQMATLKAECDKMHAGAKA